MILAFSTSSPWASIAVLSDGGKVLWQGREESRNQASGACLAMLARARADLGFGLADVGLYVADIGPGSFTGVRVGVVLAKTFAYLYGKEVAGVDSFDLVDAAGTAVLPSKRGEYFVRDVGSLPARSAELPTAPFSGFGPDIDPQAPPEAWRVTFVVDRLRPQSAVSFVPDYLIDPSISTPKRPFATVRTEDGDRIQ